MRETGGVAGAPSRPTAIAGVLPDDGVVVDPVPVPVVPAVPVVPRPALEVALSSVGREKTRPLMTMRTWWGLVLSGETCRPTIRKARGAWVCSFCRYVTVCRNSPVTVTTIGVRITLLGVVDAGVVPVVAVAVPPAAAGLVPVDPLAEPAATAATPAAVGATAR